MRTEGPRNLSVDFRWLLSSIFFLSYFANDHRWGSITDILLVAARLKEVLLTWSDLGNGARGGVSLVVRTGWQNFSLAGHESILERGQVMALGFFVTLVG